MEYQELWRRFVEPANTYRICPLMRINDAVDRDRVLWQVRSLKEQGCGGLFTYCEHLAEQAPFRFLSYEWWAAVEAFAEACVREGLDFWAYDEQDWPSGTCGGQLVEQNPQMGWKYLSPTEHDFTGPATARIESDHDALVAAAAFQLSGDVVVEGSIHDLTDRVRDNLLLWDVPPGRWRVAVYTWHLGRGGPLVPFSSDLMDPQVGRKFLELSYQGYQDAVTRVPGAAITGYFTDEPIFSMGLYPKKSYVPERPENALAWTHGFLDAFRARHGYDLQPKLPHLFHGDGGESIRTRCHYFETCSQLFSESYFGQIRRFCEETGALATGHLNGEEMFSYHLSSQGGSNLVHYRHMHIPGIDWVAPGSIPLPSVVPKYASSVAHLMGRERTWCESFAGSGWGMSFQEMRRIVNWEHVNGINMQIPISYKYSLRGPQRTTFYNPGISYQQPYWDHFRAFADYEARLCAITSGGGHVAQVALFYPAPDMWVHFRDARLLDRRSKAYNRLGDMIRQAGYDFDILDDQILLEETEIGSGRLETATESFDVLVVPQMDCFRRATLAKVVQFVRTGGAVVFVGGLPGHSVEGGADDPDLHRLLAELLGNDCHRRIVGRGCHQRACGAGRAGMAADVEGAIGLLRTSVVPDVQVRPEVPGVVSYHRCLEDGHLYLIFNHSDEARTLSLTLSAKGYPERWDPVTGTAEGLSDCHVGENGTGLKACFHPQEIVPIFLHGDRAQAAPARRAALLREIPIPGPFRFSIEETMKRPEVAWNFTQTTDGWTSTAEPLTVPETVHAGDWCEQGLASFSGIGRYETDVDVSDLPTGARVVLSLGRVGVSAEVSVNGERAGCVFFEPYEIDVTELAVRGWNRLTISVANTLANYYSQFQELTDKPLHEAGHLPESLVSGLIGPVSLRLIRCD